MQVLDGDLASIKVRVVFQAGQIEMRAGEVQDLAPGVLLPVERSAGEVIEILANGRCIGAGELVKIGDKLAVRVTRLSSDG